MFVCVCIYLFICINIYDLFGSKNKQQLFPLKSLTNYPLQWGAVVSLRENF